MNHPRIYWAIVEEDGDYSSYSKTEICAYSNKEDAEKHLAAIEALQAKLSEAYRAFQEAAHTSNPTLYPKSSSKPSNRLEINALAVRNMANREQMDRMYSRFMEQVEEFKAQMQEEADTLGIQQLDLRTGPSSVKKENIRTTWPPTSSPILQKKSARSTSKPWKDTSKQSTKSTRKRKRWRMPRIRQNSPMQQIPPYGYRFVHYSSGGYSEETNYFNEKAHETYRKYIKKHEAELALLFGNQIGNVDVPTDRMRFSIVGPAVVHHKFDNIKEEAAVFSDLLEEKGLKNVNTTYNKPT